MEDGEVTNFIELEEEGKAEELEGGDRSVGGVGKDFIFVWEVKIGRHSFPLVVVSVAMVTTKG